MEFLATVRQVLDTQFFRIGDSPITVSTVATVLLVMVVTVLASRLVRSIIIRGMTRRGGRPEVAGAVTRLTNYFMILAGVGVAFAAAGIDIGAMFTAGAIFAVGLGFAMQNISQNFVSGVILHTERTIRQGDVLGVDGMIVRVSDIGIRASIVQTRDGEDLVIPNSTLIQETVKNYTLKNATVRIRVPVGVTYGSDMALVKQTLTETANEISRKWAVSEREPLIAMMEFGSSSVNWEVGIWMDDPWEWRPAISELHEAIWWAFKTRGIVIAFPQIDVHLDAPVMESLERISSRGAS